MDVVVHTYFHFFQIASIVTLPFDVVKTRRQVELGELHAKNGNIGVISLSSLTLVNVCDGPKCGSAVEFQAGSLNVFFMHVCVFSGCEERSFKKHELQEGWWFCPCSSCVF